MANSEVIELISKLIELVITNNGNNHNHTNQGNNSGKINGNLEPLPKDVITHLMDYFVKTKRIEPAEAYNLVRMEWSNVRSYISMAIVLLDRMVNKGKIDTTVAFNALKELVDYEFQGELTYDNFINILIKTRMIKSKDAALIYYDESRLENNI
ncbi:MAG: hypothetical protein DRH49_05660 [Candidatus Coatesbacteria bacterium]|nr:MAG: hypothetical protein DRH49_05660 [Candidatus Coatesbacteria bacterium]